MDSRLLGAALGIGLGQLTIGCGAAGSMHNRPPEAHVETTSKPPPPRDEGPGAEPVVTAPLSEQDADSAVDQSSKTDVPALPPGKSRIDLMTGRETAYLIDYEHSGALLFDQTNCASKGDAKSNTKSSDTKSSDTKSGEEPEGDADEAAVEAAKQRAEEREKQLNECLKKARSKFGADVLRFRRDGLGHVQLVLYRRTGSALTELHVSNVELTESGRDAIKVDVKASVAGQRSIMRDRNQFEVRMPNAYSIELSDPQYGKLIYNEKVGLVAN
ncbi:MAG TPA: hypothetical protein VIV60_18000 [Polyangiaceae bacterium]